MEQEELKRLLVKAGSYTAKAERAPKEVEAKIRQWAREEMTSEEVQSIMESLMADGFVNEERYAQRYVSEKVNLLQKGPLMLSQELYQKGISERCIDAALSEIEPNRWQEALRKYLSARLERQKAKAKGAYDLRQRLFQLAYGRGFPTGLTEQVLPSLDLELEPSDEDEEYYY